MTIAKLVDSDRPVTSRMMRTDRRMKTMTVKKRVEVTEKVGDLLIIAVTEDGERSPSVRR